MDQDEYALDHEMLEAMVSVLRDAPTLTEMEVRHRDVTVRIRRPAAASPHGATATGTAPAAHSSNRSRNGDGQGAAGAGNGAAGVLSGGGATHAMAGTAASATGAEGAGTASDASVPDTVPVTAGLVGIFRALPQPIAPGYAVKAKQVIGYIEAMRLMNECITPVAGVVADVLIHDGQPVEYGQPLFEIAPGAAAAAPGGASASSGATGEEAGR